MNLKWTAKAVEDVERLHDFLSAVNPRAATQTAKALVAAPKRLTIHPRIGESLEEFAPREVRRLLVGHYEMRYEIGDDTIYILRIWHTSEDR